MSPTAPRVAVFVSGGGRSLVNLVERERDGRLAAHVALVVSSARDAFAVVRARELGLPCSVLRARDFADPAAFEDAVYALLARECIDLVVLAGYLARFPLRADFAGRVLNIHPALLPAFGGKGFFGHHVHEAVGKSGASVTGCTVHFVDAEYDRGPIVLQRTVPVLPGDDADAIGARVFEAEKEALPEAINLFAAKKLVIAGDRVRILP